MEQLHVSLWGEYNFKSYLPAINSNGEAKLLVLADKSLERAVIDSLTYKNSVPEVLHWPKQPTADDYQRLSQCLLNHSDKEILFNLSAGEPVSVLGLYHFALQQQLPTYLIDDEDFQHWLPPSTRQPIEVENQASLKYYFKAHQISLEKSGLDMPITAELRALTNLWASYPADYDTFRGLNYLAGSASPNFGDHAGTYSVNYSNKQHGKDVQLLFSDLEKAGLATVADEHITLASEAAKVYCNGGWLELYVYDQVRALRERVPEIQDVRLGLEIRYPEGIKNELDVVFLADNQLHLIEVKTSYLSNKIADANAIVYKLEALANALGADVKGMVISLFDLPGGTINRAGLYDIHVVSGNQIPQLQYHLKHWIEEQ
ncbi:DUF1887 family protein [Maribrevibacterium harenarium]|uniref:DUF1887 family protein n=1 Tax=Maribrevibacterium harenarium TaxID=2589817 RepID=A0A501WGT5_9GAMM|nr:DUF1887 family CARF protein [Maribrevibacterium harenarium]TPE48588.1 DUF1887 family protein [Maribrevibacterium harenarium]